MTTELPHPPTVPPTVIAAGQDGIILSGGADTVLDVRFDGRRVWSFWSQRDTERHHLRQRLARWPEPLAARLDGVTTLSVGTHARQAPLFEQVIHFGSSTRPLELVDRKGHPLGMDNTGKLVPTFENRTTSETAPLIASLETVLRELTEAGIAAFPAYGTLLGAVREGHLIGHDSDADIGYVSRHTHPFDVIRESFELQRVLARAGHQTSRYSGASIKVIVAEGDGYKRGLDVFGGYHDGERLNLMGEIRTPFRPEWIFPLGTTTLEGRTLPAPAEPERVLEVTYGPGWREPDPAFEFTTPRSTIRAFNGLFRATRARRKNWAKFLTGADPRRNDTRPSALAQQVVAERGVPAQLLDVGAGHGTDSRWFAEQGAQVVSYDYILPGVVRGRARRSRAAGHRLEVRRLNLQEFRSVFAEGARLVRLARPLGSTGLPGERVILANHLLDAAPEFGRRAFARFASMALRGGGWVYADFWCGGGAKIDGDPSRPVAVDEVAGLLEHMGAAIRTATELDTGLDRNTAAGNGRRTGRVVAEWASTN